MLDKYFEELRKELETRNAKDSQEILSYFEEIVNDHLDNGESEESIIASLGSVEQLADSICEKQTTKETIPHEQHLERRTFSGISKINIDVNAYDVTIEITDEENGWLEYNNSDDIYLDVNISNNKISIEEEDSSTIVNTFFAKIFSLRGRGFQGYLHIYCPKDKMFDLCINTVSGDVKVKDVKCDEIEFESVSGDMKLQDVFSRDLNIDTVSGDFNSQKITIIDTFKAQSVSGDFNINNLKCDEITIETVSGDVELSVDGNMDDYNIYEESLRKNFSYEGKGNKSLEIETVSGDISYRFLS